MGTEQGSDKQATSLSREIRGQIFVWFGIVGISLTIVSKWEEFVHLADAIRWVISHWTALITYFWQSLAGVFGIQINASVASLLSFISFYISLMLGSILISGRRRKTPALEADVNDFEAALIYGLFALVAGPWMLLANMYESFRYGTPINLIWAGISAILMCAVLLEGRWYDRLFGGSLYVLISVLSLELSGLFKADTVEPAIAVVCMFTMFAPSFLVPSAQLRRRLSFILIGVALIFGLSEVSKLAERLHTAARSLSE
jgi:hypothetical protein